MTPRTPLGARWLIRAASWLAPAESRAVWREEWEAELWHETNRPGDGSRTAVYRAALGAPRDALVLRLGPGRRITELGFTARIGEEAIIMANDARIALRGIRRNPGFAGLAVLTLGLGIGANAALFTLVDSVLLRPLPYPDAEQLVVIRHPVPYAGPDARWDMSPHGFMLFLDRNTSFASMGAYVGASFNMALDGTPDRTEAALVTASLFPTLGATAAAGRLLNEEDNRPGAADVVVLGHAFWQRRFAADPAIVGQVVRLDGQPFEVVGVAAAGTQLPRRAVDLYVPLTLNRAATPVNSHYFSTIARLRPEVSVAEATAEAKRLAAAFPLELSNAYSPDWITQSGFDTELTSLHEDVVGSVSNALWVVFGAVGLVLLVACANVANLFFVRAESRRREVAVRNALGASRTDLLRQFQMESLLVAVLAAGVGLFVGWAGVKLLLATSPGDIPRLDEVQIRAGTVVFTALVALVASIIFGLFPLSHLRGRLGVEALLDGSGRTTAGRGRLRIRSALVVAQVAFALMLLAGAGLLLRSAQRLRAVEPGFTAEGIMTFDVTLPFINYRDHESVYRFHDQLQTELSAIAGVESSGAVTHLPMRGARTCFGAHPADRPPLPGQVMPCLDMAMLTPGFLETMRIPVTGRTFTRADNEAPIGTIVITRSLAARLWPDQDALGRQIVYGGVAQEVIGITDDVRNHGLHEAPSEQMFFPVVPSTDHSRWYVPRAMTVTVRTTRSDPATLMPDVRAALARVDPEIPISRPATMQQVVEESMARTTFLLLMMSVAASVALALGTVGLYGVVAYVVAQRHAEIGIRMALGARSADVGSMIVRQALVLAAAGVVLGVIGALAGGRVLSAQLFEMSAFDPLTLAGVSVLLLIVAALAAWVPARRAARIDPLETMRAG